MPTLIRLQGKRYRRLYTGTSARAYRCKAESAFFNTLFSGRQKTFSGEFYIHVGHVFTRHPQAKFSDRPRTTQPSASQSKFILGVLAEKKSHKQKRIAPTFETFNKGNKRAREDGEVVDPTCGGGASCAVPAHTTGELCECRRSGNCSVLRTPILIATSTSTCCVRGS